MKLPHEFQAAESRQAEIRQHHLALVLAGPAQTFVAAVAHGDLKPSSVSTSHRFSARLESSSMRRYEQHWA